MEFNPHKCEVLSISHKRHPVAFYHNLHGQQLKSSQAAKYLGVTISKDLSWTNHINNITSYKNVKESAYKTYVRQLEYCSTV
jgi:hypothetical protein